MLTTNFNTRRQPDMTTTKQVVSAAFPQGMVKASDMAIAEQTVAPLKEGEVLIETAFLSLDPAIRYWMNAYDTYVPGAKIGAPIRCYAAGHIAASKHADFAVGDAVYGLLSAQSHIVFDASLAANAKGPLALSHADLSAGTLSQYLGVLGMPGMTAYFGLLDRAAPIAGETVFVSAASGTVGSAVGQIAKLKGCRVIGSAGSADKCAWLVDEMGFDAAFDYKREPAADALKRLAPEGIHIYFDNVGGDMLDAALGNLARGARVVLCGALAAYNDAYAGPKNYIKLISARGSMNGIIVFDYMPQWPAASKEMAQWCHAGKLKSPEHVSHGIESFPDALVALFAGAHSGKQLVKL
jgi:NADPH-dependent curcumin reductase